MRTNNYSRVLVLSMSTLLVMFFFCFSSLWLDMFSLPYWKLFLVSLILICFFFISVILEEKTFDVYLLLLLVLLGSVLIVLCDHLLIIYLGIELQTFSFFILISKNRSSIKGSEAGLKYFILGALSSGLYLLGLCLFFLSGLSLNLSEVFLFSSDILVIIGSMLVLLSLSFKLALFPLHFWIPDIYEGSSWDVIGFLSTLPKISIISILMQIIINSNLLLFCSLLSITIGTLGALNQSKLKRLLAYSGISHMGFIILGYSLLCSEGNEISYLYITIYMLTMVSLFILIINSKLGRDYYIIEIGGLQYINKLLAVTWLIIFLSIAGIPPLSGFMSKWFILWSTINYDYLFCSLVGILFSAIGAGYYLRIVKIMYFQKKSSYLAWNKILSKKESITGSDVQYILLGFGIFFSLLVILNPSPLVLGVNFVFFNY